MRTHGDGDGRSAGVLDIDALSEFDRKVITQAMMLGCEFLRHESVLRKKWRWYAHMDVASPYNKWRNARGHMYGHDDPVQLAVNYIEFSLRVAQ